MLIKKFKFFLTTLKKKLLSTFFHLILSSTNISLFNYIFQLKNFICKNIYIINVFYLFNEL